MQSAALLGLQRRGAGRRSAVELLRFATAGSVDDGKSTLIGRLLYDSKAIFEDQLESVERTSLARGDAHTDLALLTDGLRAEREQGITIDVAYRYFATPRRKFIIADTPGHIQYTRNMVTGASTADLALVLIDARNGVLEQSRRHAFLATLLGIPHLVVCVNKMDLVDWSQQRYDQIKASFRRFATKLDVHDLSFIPISALHGDNVVERSPNMAWYEGSSLLHHLEEVHIASDRNLIDARFPVQYVIRPQDQANHRLHDYRGYAGTVAGGVLKPGDEVVVLPSGLTTTIAAIDTADGPLDEAFAPMAVTVRLSDDLDISRGDMICRPRNRPHVGQDLDAMVCWLTQDSDLRPGAKLALKHTTRWGRAVIKDLHYRLDVNTLHRDEHAHTLALNQIGRVRLRTTVPLFYDEYRRNHTTGSLILIDETTNNTVAAGIILGPTELA
jgi:bifunctional enzyme CysN/CysC